MTKNSTFSSSSWIVLKFGGTSVSSRSCWNTIISIARQHHEAGKHVLIVVSALSGITDALKGIIEVRADREEMQRRYLDIVMRHQALFDELALSNRNAMQGWLTKFNSLINTSETTRNFLPWQAEVLALGELLSSTLGVAYLNTCELNAYWLDARDYLTAQPLPHQSQWANYLSASVPVSPDLTVAQQLASKGEVFITQGFIGRNPEGETVVLGRGGSDTSAGYFGALLKAERVEIWTDVAGMFSGNPRQIPSARLLTRLDYEEAQEIATTGAKVLHPRCLNPVREARVPLFIKDTNRPEFSGTEIGAIVVNSAPSIKAISARTGITLISMESIGMWQQVGFLADVFEHFKRHGLSVDLISTAETNVTVSLDPTENLLNSDVLSALCADLARVCRVKVIAPCAAITLVGRGMRSMLHKLSGVLAELGSLPVHLISQSSNNLNLTFVMDESLVAGILPHLHELLINAEALRVHDSAIFGPSWNELYKKDEFRTSQDWWIKRRDSLLKLAGEKSPRYVYDLATVSQQAQRLSQLKVVDQWYYAMKANSHPTILRELVAQGFGLECVSWNEVLAARAIVPDISASKLLFTPNFAPRDEYKAAVEMGVHITVDNLHPLQEWGDLFAGHELILRIDLGIGRGHHDKVKTGGAHSKFGLDLDDLVEFKQLCKKYNVRISALHAHLGSGIRDCSHWKEVYLHLASLAEQFPQVSALNIGGGLGVTARSDEIPLDLAQLGKVLSEIKAVYPQFSLWLEPGRYLVADAGVLLARVTQIKHKADMHYIGVDTGMNSLIRPALYDAYHEIVNLSRSNETANTLYQIVGPICESSDVLGNNRRLPKTEEGDVLLIAQAGAYGAVMASNYNLRAPAEEVVL